MYRYKNELKLVIFYLFCNVIWWRRWNCRLDGEDFLRRFEGKKIMYVGDSVSLNQWLSMVCLLHAAVPDPSRILQEKNDTISTFTFQVSNICIKVLCWKVFLKMFAWIFWNILSHAVFQCTKKKEKTKSGSFQCLCIFIFKSKACFQFNYYTHVFLFFVLKNKNTVFKSISKNEAKALFYRKKELTFYICLFVLI